MVMKRFSPLSRQLMGKSMTAGLGAMAIAVLPFTMPCLAAGEGQVLFERGLSLMKAGGDATAVFGLMEQAAALDESRARLKAAEFTVSGYGTKRDAVTGLALLEALATEGNSNALLALGDAYAKGAGGAAARQKAIAYYEQAAAAGRNLAFVRLGQIYRDGTGVDRDPVKALDYLNKAVAAGREGVMAMIGKGIADGKLGKGIPRRNGFAMLEEARRKSNPDAAVALAECYLGGLGVRRNANAALSLLRESAGEGNLAAVRKLVALYRDGHKSGVRRNLDKARQELAAVSSKLDQTTLRTEEILLDAAAAEGTASYREIEAKVRAAGPLETPGLVRKLKSVNKHAYVFMVQGQLQSLGYHNNGTSGVLSRATVRAMYGYCIQWESKALCRQGPMTNRMTDVIVTAF